MVRYTIFKTVPSLRCYAKAKMGDFGSKSAAEQQVLIHRACTASEDGHAAVYHIETVTVPDPR